MLNAINDESHSISLIDVLDLIDVRPPYFSLEDLYWNEDQWLVAKIPVQSQQNLEKTIMEGGADVGRHLSILGSCYGALINPEKTKHYYLAHYASIEFFPNYVADSRPEFLYARAKAKFTSKRELVATTELLDSSGAVCASAEINYHVLKENFFKKIFGQGQNSECDNSINPYQQFNNLDILKVGEFNVKASIGEITPEMCLGHFDDVKALPVAILTQYLLNSCYALIGRLANDETAKFIPKLVKLEASQMALCGQSVDIAVSLVGQHKNTYSLNCVAKNQLGHTIGEMNCSIEQN